MSIKINSLELENVKRIKAVKVEPTENGLTIVGGRNNQGKTSVLDAIAWALGGNKFRPSDPQRNGSVLPPNLKVTLSNGLIVERKGKNSTLKITDPSGAKSGQQILDKLIGEMALNVPKFMNSNSKDKANYLLQILGIGEQLLKLETQEKKIYNDRTMTGRIRDQKQKYADELEHYDGVPKIPVSPKELIRQQQEILARNGENQRKRQNRDRLAADLQRQSDLVKELAKKLEDEKEKCFAIARDYETANRDAQDLQDESTAELEANIANIEEINVKVRANLDKEKAQEDAKKASDEYNLMTSKLNYVRQKKMDLLDSVELPLPELTVEDGDILYKGQRWDNMSGSDQLKVSTAIVRKLNPNCGFVLLDKLEQMDLETMNEFGRWLESEGLQAIATRVSTGDECSIIIEDGYVKESEKKQEAEPEAQFTGFSGFTGFGG